MPLAVRRAITTAKRNDLLTPSSPSVVARRLHASCPQRARAFRRVECPIVVLRISETLSDGLAVLDLQGKLLGPWVEEVRGIVEAQRAKGRVRLNLEHLSFADAEGIELLRGYRRGGIPLLGVSALIEALLDSARAIEWQ